VSGTLYASSEYVQILVDEASLAMVPEGGADDLTGFSLYIEPGAPEMSSVELHLELSADLGYTTSYSWYLPIAPFLDDFQAALGWTVSGDASTGAWERADPEGTENDGQQVQPEDDHTAAPGTDCMVTGPLAGSSVGSYDVDSGSTILTSPAFDLSLQESAIVEYWRWYSNNLGNNPGQDWWTVEVSSNGGGDWTDLERTQSSANEWLRFSFALEDYITLSDQVVFRFTAADEGSASLVEAAVDDFMLYGSGSSGSGLEGAEHSEAQGFWLWQNFPNVAHPMTTIRYRLDAASPVRTTLRIYDTAGRLVRTLVDERQRAGDYRILWDGTADAGRPILSGVYYFVLAAGDQYQARKLIMVR
jgi:hypothetical protein